MKDSPYKYPAYQPERKKVSRSEHPYAHKQKRNGLPIRTVLFVWFVIVLCGVTSILILNSPERTRAQNTLDDTLVPDHAIFSTETPTGTPTQTPTASRTPEPTVDYQATQVSLDATKTQVVKITQDQKNWEIHQINVQAAQADLQDSMNRSELSKMTLTLAAPMATDQARGTSTAEAMIFEGTKTQQALIVYEETKRIDQVDGFWTFARWMIQIAIIFLFGLLAIILWKELIEKKNKKDQIELDAKKVHETEEAKASAQKLADQKKQLLSMVEESVHHNGSDGTKLATARQLQEIGIDEPERKALINLLKNQNKIYEKGGKGGGFFLRSGTLGEFFEEIASGDFPPIGTFGRSSG